MQPFRKENTFSSLCLSAASLMAKQFMMRPWRPSWSQVDKVIRFGSTDSD